MHTRPASPNRSLANLLPGRESWWSPGWRASSPILRPRPHRFLESLRSVYVSELNLCNPAPLGAGVDGLFPPTLDTSSSAVQVPAVPRRACRISFYRTSPRWSLAIAKLLGVCCFVLFFFFEITSVLTWEEAFR